MHYIVAVTGATGSLYAMKVMQLLRSFPDTVLHLVISRAAYITLQLESCSKDELHALADHIYRYQDITAPIASGSFIVEGMVVVPCSMQTLGQIAHGVGDHLIARAADVMLKDRKKLILVARETPLHLVHLENMVKVTQMGGIIMPPVPAFYHHPQTVDDIITHTAVRICDLLGLKLEYTHRWKGVNAEC